MTHAWVVPVASEPKAGGIGRAGVGMDAIEASELAACLEFELGATCMDRRVECFAVPLTRGSSRRRSRWSFLVVTDADERSVRETLDRFEIECIERRGPRRVLQAWPKGLDGGPLLPASP